MESPTVLILVATLQLAGTPASVPSGHRGKRIVWGNPLIDHNSYDIIGYYAVIADGNVFSFNLKNLWESHRSGGIPNPIPASTKCGGSLLTPTIVYTACHCLVEYVRVNETYSAAKLLNFWEKWFTVFVGWTIVDEIVAKDGASVKFAVAHQKCGRIRTAPVFDFGLFVLERPVRLRLSHMKPAQIHNAQTITEDCVRAMVKERVCLYVGFGYYNYINRQKGIPGRQSPVLQHGWRVFTNHYKCLLVYSLKYFSRTPFRPVDYVTWLCSVFFGKQRAALMKGDSGSPVACNDVRIGLVSFREPFPASLKKSMNYIAAIAFDIEANAAEFRQSLEDSLKEYYEDHSDWRPTKDYTIFPSGYTVGSVYPILLQEHQIRHPSLPSKGSSIWATITLCFLPLCL